MNSIEGDWSMTDGILRYDEEVGLKPTFFQSATVNLSLGNEREIAKLQTDVQAFLRDFVVAFSEVIEDQLATLRAEIAAATLSPRQSIAPELAVWDLLSDEALVNFEKAID